MSAILLTAGPVVTHALVVNYGPRCLRGMAHMTKRLFKLACDQLQCANLGSIAPISIPQIFIKPSPDNIELFLAEFSDLCSVDVYRAKYNSPSPGYITSAMKIKLISLGLVSQEDFK